MNTATPVLELTRIMYNDMGKREKIRLTKNRERKHLF